MHTSLAAELIVTGLVVLLAATVQRVSGFGFALFATPLLAFVMPVSDAVVVISLVAWPSSALNAWELRDHGERAPILRMVAWSVPGMLIGIKAQHAVSDRTMRLALAFSVAAAVVLLATGVRIRARHRAVAESIAGLLSGVLNTSTGTNGPPLVATLAGQDLAPDTFRATISAVFNLSGTIAIVLFLQRGLITARSLSLAALGVPLVLIGRWIGRLFAARLAPDKFRTLVLVLLGATAVSAAVRALS